MATGVRWSRDQLLVTFRLYCRTPFGKLHRLNPEIIELAHRIGRTPSAVAMKATNFASFDPVHRARNVAGLGNASDADESLWREFEANAEQIAAEAEAAYVRLTGEDAPVLEAELELPQGPTEVERTTRTRRVQAFFRTAVLASYEGRCALSDLSVSELLNASHIIPWRTDTHRRADPRNGIALNALYDRAFDRGLITFDASFRVMISPRVRIDTPAIFHQHTLLDLEGRELRRPTRFAPDPAAMTYHREHVFISR